MSDDLSDQDLKRLHDLAALRDRGVLTEDEFQRAKQRLFDRVSTTAPVAGEDSEPAQGWFRANWLVLTLVSLAVVVLFLWLLLARAEQGPAESVAVTDSGLLLNEGVEPLPGPEVCTSEAIYRQIKDIVFDQAIERFEGDAASLNSLRAAASVRMQYPVLRDYDSNIRRADCSGRMILDIPPAAQDEFGGVSALQGDLEFALQPATDGGNAVVELGGIEVVVQRIVAAADQLAAARAAASDRQLPDSYDEMLDCGSTLSDAERIICGDAFLARQDRALFDRYRIVRDMLPSADRQRAAESQRRFLDRRANCEDSGCLVELYADRADELDRMAEAQEALPL